MKKSVAGFVLFFLLTLNSTAADISGELKKWHKITLSFEGPQTSETANPNPFLDYRLDVTFSNGSDSYVVPGYFAADGDAANSSAEAGNVWRVHFCPDAEGVWDYSVSFRSGDGVSVSDENNAGSAWSPLDGESGSFTVGPNDKALPDLRAHGRLEYVGERYLRFAESEEYFLKQGADAPENFLAYDDFDNTPNIGNRRKSWAPHAGDWREGDPTWKTNKGTEIIGAINYLASEGMNVFSFLTMNIEGDDRNVFPYISDDPDDRTRMDCSKLDQWEIVLEHGQNMGMYLHFKTQETENEMLLDNGDTGTERRMYYRELIARFGHHLALNWNLGEENGALGDPNQSTAQRIAMAQYFYDNDPYHHHIVIHNGLEPNDLLGDASKLTGYSLQTSQPDFSHVHDQVVRWINKSIDAGKPWVVACDEPGDASHALVPDSDDPTHDDARRNGLWGCLIGGGAGNEWYFGYQHDHSDLTCEDFRSRDLWWDQCRIALEYFEDRDIPFWRMSSSDDKVSGSESWCLAEESGQVLVYAPEGGVVTLSLSGWPETLHAVEWFDPRTGIAIVGKAVQGGANVLLEPPAPYDTEFLARIHPANDQTPPTAPSNLNGEALGERKIRLTWSAAEDEDSGVGGYIIYRDGAVAGSVGAGVLEFTDTRVRPSTEYNYTVVAINGSGVEGETAGPLTISTWEDTTPPELVELRVVSWRILTAIFSEEMDEESVENVANYNITPFVEVKRATLADDLKSVRLICSGHEEGINYRLTVSGMTDLAGLVISPEASYKNYSVSDDKMWLFADDAELSDGAILKSIDGSLGEQAATCPTSSSKIQFQFTTREAGSWFAWGRFMFIGSDNDPNSFFLIVDGGEQLKFGNNKDYFNQWHWDGDGNVEGGTTQALSLGRLEAGDHTITIKCREPLGSPGTENILIDILYLTLQGDDVPTDETVPTGTDVGESTVQQPEVFSIVNYPNPFNPSTQIQISLPASDELTVELFDLLGHKVKSFGPAQKYEAGVHTLTFDASDLSSGVYVCRVQGTSTVLMHKMTLLK